MITSKIIILSGKAIPVRGNDIDTDEIIPARFMRTITFDTLGQFAFYDVRFNADGSEKKHSFNEEKYADANILLVNKNFGCGSSREHAIWALRGSGIKAVIADSFARIFFRNCINNGFLAIELKDASKKIKNKDKLEINLEKGKIKDLTNKKEFKFTPFPKFALDIINAGGLLNYIKK